MILSRVIEHFRKQEWTAIFLDFVIVVVGVFVGMQVNNWNVARQERDRESAVLARLLIEFRGQNDELSHLAESLSLYNESARQVIIAIKADRPPADREQFAYWVDKMTNLGRPPARSATYIQLLSSGDLDLLRSEKLQHLLITFDQEIERNRFIHEKGADLIFSADGVAAATNTNFQDAEIGSETSLRITDIDFDELKEMEGKIEWIFYMHRNNLETVNRLRNIARQIIETLESAP